MKHISAIDIIKEKSNPSVYTKLNSNELGAYLANKHLGILKEVINSILSKKS